MPAPNPLSTSDQIRAWVTSINTWFNYIVGLVSNLTSGHIHDGSDSRKIDHANLLNKGSNTHSQIDSAVSSSTSHIADSVIHVTSGDKTSWNGVATEVGNARNSSAKSVIYETLDARLEAIETSSTPEAHNNLSGRDTEATGVDSEDHAHLANALWDSTESQTVQDTLDEKLTESDLTTAINGLADNALDGDVVETATDTAKGTLLLGATGGAAAYNHTHDYEDEDIGSGLGTIVGGTTYAIDLKDRINGLYSSAVFKNELPNGHFRFLGYDGSNDSHTLGEAVANADYPFGIPGWHFDGEPDSNLTISYTNSDLGTPPWGDYSTSEKQRTHHSIGFLKVASSDWTTEQSNYFVSDDFYTDINKTYTISFDYKSITASATNGALVGLRYYNGVGWVYEASSEIGNDNDANWHNVTFSGFIPTGTRCQLVIQTNNTQGHDMIFSRMAVWEGTVDSTTHTIPECYYSHKYDEYCLVKTSTTVNTSANPGQTFEEKGLYKKTYYTSLPVSSAGNGMLTLNIPDAHYVYDVHVSSDYLSTQVIPTTPPSNVSAFYYCWDITNCQDWTALFSSLNISYSPPADTGNLVIKVDYWPAN